MTCKDCIHYFVCSFSGGEIYPSEESIKADCNHFVASNEMERINKNMDAMVIEHHRLLADTKADTVRKMHSEIKERCIKGGIYPAFVASTIDQIEKELLEGKL